MNRLCQKRLLDYVVDENDARVYIYTPLKSRDECLKEKSNRFADSYFSGSHANAAAALLKNVTLTEEQAEELKSILEACRFQKQAGRRKAKANDRQPDVKDIGFHDCIFWRVARSMCSLISFFCFR